jgi:hypothetical protein
LFPLLGALGFPAFTKKIAQNPTAVTAKANSATPPAAELPKSRTATPELTKLVVTIDQWLSGNQLVEDAEPRELLFDVVRRSIPWQDITSIPARERQVSLEKMSIIEIEGQRSRARGAIVRFPRSKDTAELILALARFRYLGKSSWDFDDGERSKRTVAIWLRRHSEEVINSLRPQGVDTDGAIVVAVEFLVVSFMLGHQKKLPAEDLPSLAEALFEDFPVEVPKRFSGVGNTVVEQIQKQHPSIREMLAHELNVPQGLATSCNFIDPRPLFRAVRRMSTQPEIRRLGDDFHKDYWGRRYRSLISIPTTIGLWEAERTALRDLRDTIMSLVQGDSGTETALANYGKDLADIREALKQTHFVFPYPEFDSLWNTRLYTQRMEVWSKELRRAEDILGDSTIERIATYSPEILDETKNAIAVAENYLDALIQNVERNMQLAISEGDPDQLTQRLTSALEQIAELQDQGKK